MARQKTQVGTADFRPSWCIVTRMQLAEFFGVSITTTHAWSRRGMPMRVDGKFDLLEVCKWKFAPVIAAPDPETGERNPEQMPAKERLDWYSGTLKKRELELKEGALIEAPKAEEAMAYVIKSFVSFLEQLPDILERDAGLNGAQVERMQRLTDAQRDRLHSQLVAGLRTPADEDELGD